MKKRTMLLAFGAIALAAVITAGCSGNSAQKDAAKLPTDGPLGELPKYAAEYDGMLRDKAAETIPLLKDAENNKEKLKEAIQWEMEQRKIYKEKCEELWKTLEGKEIPTEVAEGLPIKLNGNMVITKKKEAAVEGEFTAEASPTPADGKPGYWNFIPVAFDSEGNAIEVAKGRFRVRRLSGDGKLASAGDKMAAGFWFTVEEQKAPLYAKLAKIVILDRESEAFKAAEDKIKADKEAYEAAAKELTDQL